MQLQPDKPGKFAQSIPIYGTKLGQCTRNRANAGPIFLVCRVPSVTLEPQKLSTNGQLSASRNSKRENEKKENNNDDEMDY